MKESVIYFATKPYGYAEAVQAWITSEGRRLVEVHPQNSASNKVVDKYDKDRVTAMITDPVIDLEAQTFKFTLVPIGSASKVLVDLVENDKPFQLCARYLGVCTGPRIDSTQQIFAFDLILC